MLSKHSRKIATGFSLVLILMMVLLIFGLTQVRSMHDQTEVITYEHNVKTRLITQMRNAVYERMVQVRNIMLEEDVFERDTAKLKFNRIAPKFLIARGELRQMKLSEKEIDLLNEIDEQTGRTYLAQIQLINNSIANPEVKITPSDLEPVFDLQQQLIALLVKMIGIQAKQTEVAVNESQRSFEQTRQAIFILGTAALILGIFVASYIVRLTESQEKNVMLAMRELADSNDKLEDRVKVRTAELAEARDRALASNKAKDTFLANMSHELRTPLNVIIGYSELLEEMTGEDGNKQYQKDINKIHSAAMQQLALVNSLLDISKIEEGKLEIHPVEFDVENLLAEIEASVNPLMAKNNNKFNIKCSYGIGMMYSDNVRIRQILLNLLSNAAKFTKDGKVHLDVNRDPEKDEIKFAVTDTGIGIPDEYIDKMFDKFTQEDSSTTRKYGGTGLGLSISRQLSQQLNGDISVSSKKGQGSTFVFKVPSVYAA